MVRSQGIPSEYHGLQVFAHMCINPLHAQQLANTAGVVRRVLALTHPCCTTHEFSATAYRGRSFLGITLDKFQHKEP
jgi:hypothetical protein